MVILKILLKALMTEMLWFLLYLLPSHILLKNSLWSVDKWSLLSGGFAKTISIYLNGYLIAIQFLMWFHSL